MDKVINVIQGSGMKSVLIAIVIFLIGYIAIRVALRITERALKKSGLDAALHTFIVNAIKILLWIVLIVTVLGYLGIPMTTFVTVLGAGGVAVALALKDSLGNVAGGILLLINKPFGKGDFVDINGTSGVVDNIDLLITTLKTPDNKVITVPNGTVTTSIITNYSREELRRVDCVFRIGYDSPIGKAKDAVLAVTEVNEKIVEQPAAEIVVSSQDENAVNLSCSAWCKAADYWSVKYFLEENVKLALDEADISVPHSQMDVRIIK